MAAENALLSCGRVDVGPDGDAVVVREFPLSPADLGSARVSSATDPGCTLPTMGTVTGRTSSIRSCRANSRVPFTPVLTCGREDHVGRWARQS